MDTPWGKVHARGKRQYGNPIDVVVYHSLCEAKITDNGVTQPMFFLVGSDRDETERTRITDDVVNDPITCVICSKLLNN